MKASRVFYKLDRVAGEVRPSLAHRKSPRAAERLGASAGPDSPAAIDKKTWIAWRMKLGAGRKEAIKLWEQYGEWLAQEARQPRPRVLQVAPWQDWEREFRAWLDEMPRKPVVFFAMVAVAEKRRAQKALIAARKTKSRERYERQYARRR